MRILFGPKSDGVTREWGGLHNEELCDPYVSSNIIRVIKLRKMRWAGHMARLVDKISAHGVSVGKTDRKRTVGVPWCRWNVNKGIGRQEMRRTGLIWLRL